MKKYLFKRTLSEEHRRKISSALQGRKLSDETKSIISKRLKEIWSQIPYENEEKNKELKEKQNG